MKTDLHTAQASLEKYKLSPQQRHLWKLQQTQVSDPFFTQCRVRVEGPADIAALRTAIEQVAQRHDILRASFQILRGDDSPSPLIDVREHKLEIFEHDLTKLSETQQAEQLAVLSRQMSEPLRGVDPRPDFRVHLLQLHEERCEMLLRVNALCSDGAGLRSIVREIAQLYDMRTADHEPALLAPVQYTDVSRIFNELLDEEDSSLGTEYWQRQNLLAVEWGQLGFEQRSTTSTHFAPEVFKQPLKGITLEQLKAAAEAHGATVEQWLLACWKVLLSRLTGRNEVVAGVAFANRDYDLDDAVGLFSRYIPLRSHLTSDLSFNDLLKRVAGAMEEGREWQDYFSWDHLTATNGDSNSAGAAFCEFAFDYTEAQTTYSAADLTFTIAEPYSCTDRFRLKLACTVEPGGSLDHLCLHYDSSQLRAGDVARTGGYLCTLLLGSVADPLSAVSRLPLIGQTERRELLAQMGRREFSGPASTTTLHHLFEQQVERRAHAVAVECGGESVSYGELNERAERLAKRLQQRGVGAETLVGLLLERSVEMVVAILGVLKAGGAYVPLDPGYPDERVRYVVEDAEVRVVVTAANQAERVAGLGLEQVVCVDREERAESEALGAEKKGEEVSGENLCYVIYTSGSTGRPKGVMVTHANVTRLFTSTRALFDFSEEDVWTLFHSYAFDFSVWELWGALLYGGRLVVVPFWESRSPESLRRTLVEHEVTVLNQTPSAFRQFMAEEERSGRPGELSLRLVVFGGEALEMGSLRGWMNRHEGNGPRLVNMYGITETTVHVTYAEVTREEVESGGASRIGVGLSDLSVYVLDEWGELVGVGMKGELYIGGAGVARGYLQRPELTAERFIPDAFSSEAGARLYRTGDLARYRADGELEYLGRIDNQVKIRGYRIELGEIEAALSAVSGVRVVVVDVRPGLGGTEKRLVAYVVWEAGAEGPVTELRRRLKERLPDYMSPSAYVELAQLPLTANGKVDRRALPEPEAEGGNSSSVQREAGRTPVEELLCGIWAEVLGVEQFGLDDNFFDLGGHSLLATGVASRIRERFGIEFQMRSLFESPTISALAVLVETNLIGHASMDEIAAALERLDQLSNDDIKTLLLNEDRLTADLDTS
jgi:amino acid adenylation domain-containing protein